MPYVYSTDEELDRSTNRWMAAGVGFLILLAAVFPFYRWYEPDARADSRAAQAASLAAQGENLWQDSCASCHGASGEGATAPALNSTQFLQSATDDQIDTLIAVGIPGSTMDPWSLDHGGGMTSEQIKSIVTYIRSWEPDAPDNPDWRSMIGG